MHSVGFLSVDLVSGAVLVLVADRRDCIVLMATIP